MKRFYSTLAMACVVAIASLAQLIPQGTVVPFPGIKRNAPVFTKDDVLVTPEQHSVYLGGQAEDVYQLSADGNGYRLTFTEDQTSSDEHMTQFFDPQKLTAEQVQQLYKSLVMEKPTYETVYYYFPEVNDNM